MNILEQLQTLLGKLVQHHKNISHYLTLRTKTTAEYYFEAESREDWKDAYLATKVLDIPLFVLGGGSNMAVLHDEIPGLVVRNMYQKKAVIKETDEYVHILFSSGYAMARVVKETTDAGYEGFEYHMGLPGTVGGAIYMNSKWTKPVSYIGDNLVSATLLDKDGKIKLVTKDYFKFAYDYSILQQTKEILLEGTFLLKKSDSVVLKERAIASLEYRKQTQPYGVATGGCFFQNIGEANAKRLGFATASAGNLIDKAGLKGKNCGGFIVSEKHANFIVNTGEGKAEDLVKLLNIVKTTVKEKFDVELHEEVVIV